MARSPEMQAEYLKNRANAKWATKPDPNPANTSKTDSPFNKNPAPNKKFKSDLFEDL